MTFKILEYVDVLFVCLFVSSILPLLNVVKIVQGKEPRTHPEPNYQLELEDLAININSFTL